MDAAISKACQSDYDQIADLWEASVRATHRFVSDADIDFYRPLLLGENLDGLEICKAVCCGRIAAFIAVAGRKIEMLFVHPDYFRKAIGTKLVRYAFAKFNADSVDVNEDNTIARAFYEKMGFRVTGRSPTDPCGKPYPVLFMSL